MNYILMLYKMLLFVIVVDLMWDFILDDIIKKIRKMLII